jgi:hypothetical protein
VRMMGKALLQTVTVPPLNWTCEGNPYQLYFGNVRLMEGIITDLRLAGLFDCIEDCIRLHNDPQIRTCLQCLAKAFEDPLDRQVILDWVTHPKRSSHYLEDAHELY